MDIKRYEVSNKCEIDVPKLILKRILELYPNSSDISFISACLIKITPINCSHDCFYSVQDSNNEYISRMVPINIIEPKIDK